MIICNDCGAVFDNDNLEVISEGYPYGDGAAYEKMSICPLCKSDDISQAEQCAICGQAFPAEELDVICKDCQETVKGKITDYIALNFNSKTIEWLDFNWNDIKLVEDDE